MFLSPKAQFPHIFPLSAGHVRTSCKAATLSSVVVEEAVAEPGPAELASQDTAEGRADHGARNTALTHRPGEQVDVIHAPSNGTPGRGA